MNNLDKPHKLDLHSASSAQINMDALYQIAPQCFAETRDPNTGSAVRTIDFNALRQMLGDQAIDAPAYEAYQFTWVGKHDARAEAARPTDKTLRPITADSLCWDATRNLYIEGDNLEVLKILQKSYLGKVKMIYIDPPYNTGNDFVYRDNFAADKSEYLEAAGATDSLGNRYIKNTDTNGRYHSDWCSMIYSRLMVARTLLSDDGVIFISIDENEVHNLRKICDELFGEGNFISQLGWQKVYSPKNQANNFSNDYEYVLCYARNIMKFEINLLPRTEKMNARYKNPDNDPRGPWKPGDCVGTGVRARGYYEVISPQTGKVFNVPQGKHWVYAPENMKKMIETNQIWFGVDGNAFPSVKQYLSDVSGRRPSSLLLYEDYGHTDMAKKDIIKLFPEFEKVPFDTPKPVKLIKMLSIIGSNDDDIILDFFSGSATTAQAVMELNAESENSNRKYILIQIEEQIQDHPEAVEKKLNTISDIGKERIRRAGAKIKSELQEQIEKAQREVSATQAQLNAEQGKMLNDEVLKSLTEKLAQQQSELKSLQERYNNLDTGFRVLRLDSSNFQDVYLSPKEYEQGTLEFYEDNIKTERTDLDLLFGCMLSWGVQLSLPMQSEVVEGKTIYTVNHGDLVACFADKVSPAVIEAMADKQPLRVIFRDSCFESDADKINIYETFKQKMDWSDQEVFKNIRVI